MLKQYQSFHHDPEKGTYGDCHRTCIACLLDLSKEEVPNFGEHYGDIPKFFEAERHFLQSKGIASVNVAYSGEFELQQVLNCIGAANPTVYYILGGVSQRGVNHSVIGCADAIIWDPFPGYGEKHSITGPCTDGYFWVQYFTPLQFVKN